MKIYKTAFNNSAVSIIFFYYKSFHKNTTQQHPAKQKSTLFIV